MPFPPALAAWRGCRCEVIPALHFRTDLTMGTVAFDYLAK
jgi:hypothetical protein